MLDNHDYEEALNTHGEEGMDDVDDETGAVHLVPAPSGGSHSEVTPELQALIEREAGAMLREAFYRILTACKHNHVRLLAVVRKRYRITPVLADNLINTEEIRSHVHE